MRCSNHEENFASFLLFSFLIRASIWTTFSISRFHALLLFGPFVLSHPSPPSSIPSSQSLIVVLGFTTCLLLLPAHWKQLRVFAAEFASRTRRTP